MKRKAYGRDAVLTLRMLFTSSLLVLLYVAFALVLFYVLNAGIGLMLVIVIGLAFFQYFTSDKLALAASGAKIVERHEAPELHDMVERLCAMSDLPKPRVAVVDTDVPNAFATGRNSNNNNQVPVWLIVTLVSIVVYAISFVLIRTISRYREYAADRGSALITGAPEYLMSALQKISSDMMRIPQRDLREVAGMNAFFIIPTSVKERTAELFMDHPPLEKRLAALGEIAREMGRPTA